MKKNYYFYFGIIVLFSLFIVLSCSQKNSYKLTSYKPLDDVERTDTVNFVGHWLNEGDREMFVRNIARVYEFENQNIKINLKFPEEIYYDHSDRTSNEKYIARVVEDGLNDWDVLRVNSEFREVYTLLGDINWAKRTLVDFSQIDEFKENTIPGLLNDKAKDEWNGIIPGPYIEGQYWAIWTNKKVAEKLGIEVKQFGMTFEDFEGYLKAAYEYNQNNPDDKIIPIYESYVWETSMSIAIMLYASILNDPDEFMRSEITDRRLDAWGKTLQAVERISKYQPLDPSWRETAWSDTHNMMIDGECLFYLNGSWMYNIWKGLDKDRVWDIYPCEYPAMNPHKVYPTAYQIPWAVPKNAKHKDEAVKFLLAMNTPQIAEMWSRYTKCPSGIKGNLASAALGGDQFETFATYVQDKFSDNGFRYYESSAWILDDWHGVNETNVFFKEVIQGEITAAQAMDNIRMDIRMMEMYR